MRKTLREVGRGTVLALIVAALAACAPSAPSAAPESTASSSSTPTPTPTPTPVPEVLLMSVTGLAVVDSAGTVTRSVDYTDPEGTVAFLTDVMGTPPELDDRWAPKGMLEHVWPGVTCVTGRFSIGYVLIRADTLAGLTVQTAEGVHVGSTRDEVLALDPWAFDGDYDGDGLADSVAVQVVPHPGTTSLSRPGEEGVDYVWVHFAGNTVDRLSARASDWTDI